MRPLDPPRVARIRSRLLARWRRERRDLPWRRTRDPYAILVSEVMLQQTRVETAIPYFERFLRRFPTPAALARAPLSRVLATWSGLGYYRRARFLRDAARTIVRSHGGRFPRDEASIRALPGVGPYTAGAVLSIAFGRPAPILDGNAARVLTRLLALRGSVARNEPRLWRAAAALVPPREPGAFNQALMELGALVCTPRNPSCGRCPLRTLCAARALGIQARIPPARRRPGRTVEWASALVRRRGRILLVRRPDRGLLAGLWELPTVEGRRSGQGRPLALRVRELLGVDVPLTPLSVRVRHGIEDRAIRIRLFRGDGATLPARRRPAIRWCTPGRASALPLAAAARKSIAAAGYPTSDRRGNATAATR